MDLLSEFNALNRQHFGGTLPPPKLVWNSRLRIAAGRFVPGHRTLWWRRAPAIEIALYLREEAEAERLIRDTLGHEMIHYWLWLSRKPYGHTAQFRRKMVEMGVSRYNPVPRRRPMKYTYTCPACRKEFQVRKRLRALACADCCGKHSGGRFDARFLLFLSAEHTPDA
ncbi:MAG: SprT-like domain-containing protein [Bacteriovoracia bacterium]